MKHHLGILTPRKRYVLGWCVEVRANIGSFTEWTETLRKDGDLRRCGRGDQTGIWPKEQAIAIATKHRADPVNARIGWQWYAREMMYETHIPEHAQGLREVGVDYRPEVAL